MGGEKKVSAHKEKGFYTARERIAKLVDAGSFLELGLLNTSDQQGAATKSPTDGLIGALPRLMGDPSLLKRLIRRSLRRQKEPSLCASRRISMNTPSNVDFL